MQNSRELVRRCLDFEYPERIPHDLWVLPWAEIHYPREISEIRRLYPNDFVITDYAYPPSPKVRGDRHTKGNYTDEWGCVFENCQDGIIGEVKQPIIADLDQWRNAVPPYKQLPENPKSAYDRISRFYEKTDKFVFANCCPRPWERYQFLRGTENALIDVMEGKKEFTDLLIRINDFYLQEFQFWVKAEVDGIMFMDDWGAQQQLLIPPDLWRDIFKPIYREYCTMVHAEGKYIFMHTDGCVQEIFGDFIEIGIDAINSQLFTMDMKALEEIAKGKITLWGEIDRQHVLTSSDPQQGRDAVRKVASHFFDPRGGLIAQFEFGLGTNPATALAVLDEWHQIEKEGKWNG